MKTKITDHSHKKSANFDNFENCENCHNCRHNYNIAKTKTRATRSLGIEKSGNCDN